MYYSTSYSSPLGTLTLAGNEGGIVGLWIEGQKYFGAALGEETHEQSGMPILDDAKSWLDSYFTGGAPSISELPLAPVGSAFRQEVWRILCGIPYGEVTTYGDIAKRIAAESNRGRMSAQAVGGAVGHNPVSIIIPCHRVVGSNGSLTGYAGGIGLKIKLLELEGVDMSRLFVPATGTAL
jgi:methylated-DNA-[protein]-cysteine S-methyltransferase